MAFNNIKIVGDGTAQVAVTNTAILEAVSTALVAYNTTAGALEFTMLLDGVEVVREEVPANGSYRLPDKLNIPGATELTINAPIGVSVTLSSYQSALDAAGAVTVAQQAALDATTNGAAQVTLAEDQVALAVAAKDLAEAALGTTTNPVITGSITEETATATDVLEPDNGTMQYRTLVANTTFTDGLTEGQTLTLYVTNAGFTITYPTTTWDGDAEPTLGTTDRLYFEKVNSVLYGFHTATFA